MAEEARDAWIQVIENVIKQGKPDPLPRKVFKPKYDLEILESYSGRAPPGYWEKFPANYDLPRPSLIDHDKLRRMAVELGVQGPMLDQVLVDLQEGANIGCVGKSRLPTRSTNAPSAYQFGPQVSDAIAEWTTKKVVYGPVTASDLPSNAKVNGIMVKEKPNGSVRIINNLSAPEGRAVNEGIDKNDFPAVMSSTPKFVKSLNYSGPGSWICKIDWGNAYKHISVRKEDLPLQWFQWMDRFFLELALIFGGVSSVGIYDRCAKVVLELVLAKSGFPRRQVCQHLDDVPAVGLKEDIMAFDDAYYAVAEDLGVQLAPRDDPEKAFGPSQEGVVFGVHYDTVTWTWAVPRERLARLLIVLHEVMELALIPPEVMESVSGKLINVRPLVPGSRFHISQLLAAVADIRRADKRREKSKPVVMTPLLLSQLEYWSILLPACSGRTQIPRLDSGPPAWAEDYFTDAAVGSLRDTGRGLGAVGPEFWFFVPWPRCVNSGELDEQGRSLARKMSLLELLGPLFVVAAGADACRGRDVRVWVDNAGSVHIYRKGYCPNCPRTSTVARAISVVAVGLRCRLYVCKIRRCSNRGSRMADAISKGALRQFADEWRGTLTEAARIPRSLLEWLRDPVEDHGLGDRILAEVL